MSSCKDLNHDFKHAIRKGRANYVCPVCGDQLMLLMLFMFEAGIDALSDFDCTVPERHNNACACELIKGHKSATFNFHSEYECRNDKLGILKA